MEIAQNILHLFKSRRYFLFCLLPEFLELLLLKRWELFN